MFIRNDSWRLAIILCKLVDKHYVIFLASQCLLLIREGVWMVSIHGAFWMLAVHSWRIVMTNVNSWRVVEDCC